jgi:hypothetical protein
MKIKLLFTSLLLAISTTVVAEQQTPDKCPSIAALRNAHLEKYLTDQNAGSGGFEVSVANKFDTNSVWRLWISEMKANNYDEARWKLNVYLNQIATFRDGPLAFSEHDVSGWICLYEGYNKLRMVAITPDFFQQPTSLTKKYSR